MDVQGGEDVYATLLTTDTYLPGALVLAHSLRDGGSTKKLAVLVTLDTVSGEVVTQLKAVYDYVIPVGRIKNGSTANLQLMNRPDLHSAFTKVNLWKQTQFRKIVYIDADVVAYRAPDELFDLPYAFSAAPDIGWPDLFNTGVMALTPNLSDYYALVAMAERGISFDGADQGLLNMYFKNDYHRLSFTYNVTPSAHYQYVPAYRHFQSSINMVHFIGTEKPWFQGRPSKAEDNPFDDMIGRWWAVYDRHYKKPSPQATAESAGATEGTERVQQAPELVQYFVKGEYHPTVTYVVPTGEPQPEPGLPQDQVPPPPHTEPEHKPEPPPMMPTWDAQRQPPPPESQPEAVNFPQTHYEMSSDTAPFVPPERYPSPPRNMWYEVPREKPAPVTEKPRPIFPWESHQPRASRVFANEPSEPSVTEESTIEYSESSTAEHKSEPVTPTTPSIRIVPSDPWSNFTRVNAWDDVPEIEKYVDTLPWHRRTRSHGPPAGQEAPGSGGGFGRLRGQFENAAPWSGFGSKLTDFPSEVERPSLPVTPAPIRRPKFWGGGGPGDEGEGDDGQQLPAAEGVPAQSDWDPIAQLQKLARQQSELLLQKLGGGAGGSSGGTAGAVSGASGEGSVSEGREIPASSPTYAAQSSTVLSPKPVKPGQGAHSLLEGEQEATPRNIAEPAATTTSSTTIPEPSYSGPGVAWEKDEGVPEHAYRLPPTEEEEDVLDA
ncbi:Glycogenin [Pleurostoma richardsiae]|uniref:glycogenin glucosyltransferase n=1 Tax=Pleurostoma richardsiae TaxID=41990 RepID=A0AA38VNF5_9PEZI|nr:Glycogenin [Pleurostoma richardsiae]